MPTVVAIKGRKEGKNVLVSFPNRADLDAKQDAITDLNTIRAGAALGATALQSYTETDPTVPDWAKADTKPSYTAAEVHALPDTTVIPTVPTKLSEFTDDLGTSPVHSHSQYLTEHQSLDGKQDVISDLDTIRSGASLGATAVQPDDLATVASTGSYTDLTNKPTIPTVTNTYSATSTNAMSGKAVASAISSAVSSVLKYKGTKTSYSDLPTSGNTTGDVWNITNADSTHGVNAGDNVAWTGSAWDVLAGTVDISGKADKTEIPTKLSELTDDLGSSPVHTHSQYLTEHQDISGKADKADLATVATTGSYNDLTNKPTIPDISGKVDKEDLASYLPLSGGTLTGNLTLKNSNADITATSTSSHFIDIQFTDTNDYRLGFIRAQDTASNTRQISINAVNKAYKPAGGIAVSIDDNDVVTTTALTPSTSDNSTKIATTAFVKAQKYITSADVPTNLSAFTDDLGSSPVHTHEQYLENLDGYFDHQFGIATIDDTADDVADSDSVNLQSLDDYLPKAGGSMTGSLALASGSTSTTPATSDSSTKIATTAFVKAQGYITSSASITGNAATATKATQDGDGKVIASTYLPLAGGTLTGSVTGTNFQKQAANINIDSAQTSSKEDWALQVVKSDAQTTNTGTLMQVGVYSTANSQDYIAGLRVGNPRRGNLPTADTIAAGTDNTGANTGSTWNNIGMRYNYKSNKAFAWTTVSPTLDTTSPEYNATHLVTVSNLLGTIPSNSTFPLTRNSDDTYMFICGGKGTSDGSFLCLTGKNNTNAGAWWLTAHNGSKSIILKGTATGSLTWNNKNLITTASTDTCAISITGNAATATKATQDADGNVISETYIKDNDTRLSGSTYAGSSSSKANNWRCVATMTVNTASSRHNSVMLSIRELTTVATGDARSGIMNLNVRVSGADTIGGCTGIYFSSSTFDPSSIVCMTTSIDTSTHIGTIQLLVHSERTYQRWIVDRIGSLYGFTSFSFNQASTDIVTLPESGVYYAKYSAYTAQ